jgi:hypothetical protein
VSSMDLSVRPESPISLGEFEVTDIRPGLVANEIASDVMVVQGSAYAARFPEVAAGQIVQSLEADPDNDHQMDATLENLSNGPFEHWYWTAVLERDAQLGRMAVVAWALCTVGEERINVLDVHTRPDRQNRGLGSAALLLALRNARDDEQLIDLPDTAPVPVRLHVARASQDEEDWLTRWYRTLGLRDTGEVSDAPLTFGDPIFRQDRYRMEGDYTQVMSSLRTNLAARGADLSRL